MVPDEDPTSPLPNRDTPLEQRHTRSRCRYARIFGLAIALVFCVRICITGILERRSHEVSHGPWQQTNATVVGANATDVVRGEYDYESSEMFHYCPLLNYITMIGENITTIGNNNCSLIMNETLLLVGTEVQIRYDPNNPKEFMEQAEYERDMKRWTLTIVTGVLSSLIFGFLLIRLIVKKTGEGIISNNEGEEESTGLERKEREELIRSKFHFQKVSSDKCNVDAANIRSKWEQMCENKEDVEEGADTTEETDEEEVVAGEFPPKGGESSPRRSAGVVECMICLEEYKKGEIICTAKTAKCNHIFHEKCVTDWLVANHDECPLCRVNVIVTEDSSVTED